MKPYIGLLNATDYLSKDQFQSLQLDSIEILKIITTIILKAKSNIIPQP